MEGGEPQDFLGPVQGGLVVSMGRTKGVWSWAYANVVVPNGVCQGHFGHTNWLVNCPTYQCKFEGNALESSHTRIHARLQYWPIDTIGMAVSKESSSIPSWFWSPFGPKSSTSRNLTLQVSRPRWCKHGVRSTCWTTYQTTMNAHDTPKWTMLGLSTVFAISCGDDIEGFNTTTNSCWKWSGEGIEGWFGKVQVGPQTGIGVGPHGKCEWGP